MNKGPTLHRSNHCRTEWATNSGPLSERIRGPILGEARVEHARDRWVVHDREGLSLCFIAAKDFSGIVGCLQDFQGNRTLKGFFLVGDVDRAHRALSKYFGHFISADVQGLGLTVHLEAPSLGSFLDSVEMVCVTVCNLRQHDG